MTATLRPFNPVTDYPPVAALSSLLRSEPMTGASLREWDSRFPEDSICHRIVAVGEDAKVSGVGEAYRLPWFREGLLHLMRRVLPG
jgi:hypothetical protein